MVRKLTFRFCKRCLYIMPLMLMVVYLIKHSKLFENKHSAKIIFDRRKSSGNGQNRVVNNRILTMQTLMKENVQIVTSSENSEIDRMVGNSYDGENPLDLRPGDSDDEDYYSDYEEEEEGEIDELSKFVDDQTIEPVNKKVNKARLLPGHYGKAVYINESRLTRAESEEYNEGWRKHGYNEFISNRIPLYRILPDFREKECLSMVYGDNLPDASVIIVFHNEAWSVLLRTVHSILARSPPYLLKELILVDDYSDSYELKKPLDHYMSTLDKVTIMRTNKTEGITGARLLGYDLASGDTVIFLDSHVECALGWLEPILHEISRNWSTVVSPVIDDIDRATFRYVVTPSKYILIGGLTWDLSVLRLRIPQREQERRRYRPYLPVRTPVLVGSIFAINKKYFDFIRKLDEGTKDTELWDVELSLRVWLCGGSIVIIPCSHVGHLLQTKVQGNWTPANNTSGRSEKGNTWLDTINEYLREENITGTKYKSSKLTSEVIYNGQRCHTMEWYRDVVYPDMVVRSDVLFLGEIKSRSSDLCISVPNEERTEYERTQVYRCGTEGGSDHKLWMYTKKSQIRSFSFCLDNTVHNNPIITRCDNPGGTQMWTYRSDYSIQHTSTGRCLQIDYDEKYLTLETCNRLDSQKWDWRPITSWTIKNGTGEL